MSKTNNDEIEMIDCRTLHPDPRLKPINDDVVNFMVEAYDWKYNNELTPFTVNHALSYLDSLTSLPFDKIGRNDRQKVAKAMEMVLNKTVELLTEARQ